MDIVIVSVYDIEIYWMILNFNPQLYTINIIKFCLLFRIRIVFMYIPEYPSQYTNNHSFSLYFSYFFIHRSSIIAFCVFAHSHTISWNTHTHTHIFLRVCGTTRDFSMADACRLYTTNHVRLITLRDGRKNGRKRELNERVANKITEFALAVRDTLLEGFYHVKKIAPVCTFRFAILLIQGASNIIFFFCSHGFNHIVIAKYPIK